MPSKHPFNEGQDYCRMLTLEHSAILLTCISDNWSWKPIFGLFESGQFTQFLLFTKIPKSMTLINLWQMYNIPIQVLAFQKSWRSFSPIIVCILAHCMLPFWTSKACTCIFILLALIVNIWTVIFHHLTHASSEDVAWSFESTWLVHVMLW